MSEKDGGPAFPHPEIHDSFSSDGKPETPYRHMTASGGMTLRDYFAAKAMQSIYMRPGGSPICDPNDVGYIADIAYRMADAMLEARKS